jgi:hypothetical protein
MYSSLNADNTLISEREVVIDILLNFNINLNLYTL